MWNAKCHSGSELHVEQMARERIIFDLRNYHNTIISEEEVKERVLRLLRIGSHKEQIESDRDSNIPKYMLYGTLPDTDLPVCLYILEYEAEQIREIKTIIDKYNILFNKNAHEEFINQKEKRAKRIQHKIQKGNNE